MQTIAVFAAILAVASAASIVRVPSADSAIIESHRLGGSFSYSTQEGHAHAVVSPVVQNVVNPVATTYSLSGVPVSSLSYSGYPVVANSLGNVAVYRTSGISGVQNVVVPASSLVHGQTPASTVGISQLSSLGVVPVSSVVV